MGRSVTDVAILLGAMQSPFGAAAGRSLPADYTRFLRQGALAGARIGVDRRYFTEDYGGEPDLVAETERALDAMRALGATLVDTDTGDAYAWFDAEFTVLLYEFKVQIAQYLSKLTHTRVRTLADLIAFNADNCRREMRYFGQEVFELAEETSGDLGDPAYLEARELCVQLTRAQGIDAALQSDRLDAIVAPGYSFASSVAAVSGYPSLSLPLGLTPEGRPAGLWMYGGFLSEPRLLALAYDLEQGLAPRPAPRFVGAVPDAPPDAGLCDAPAAAAAAAAVSSAKAARGARVRTHLGTGKPLGARSR
jgi:amidase